MWVQPLTVTQLIVTKSTDSKLSRSRKEVLRPRKTGKRY